MNAVQKSCTSRCLLLTLVACFAGCNHHKHVGPYVWAPAPEPLGAKTDAIMKTQELNAEASKYVVYANEFQLTRGTGVDSVAGWKLTSDGEDHLQRIAVNLKRGDQFPVVIEESQTSPKPGTEHGYPIHGNEELDSKRRLVVVAALEAFGVEGADQRVFVGPAFAEGFTAAEASRAYSRGLRGGGAYGNGGGGYGGYGGGFGGGGYGR